MAVERCAAEVENLKGWQRSQNGAIYRVEDKVDKLMMGLLTVMMTVAASFLGTIFLLLKGGGH